MATIQWYPGHMTKARRELAAAIPLHDVVIEVLDARMPKASENPVLRELRGEKPCLKVLSKSDLADPLVTQAWLRHFETTGGNGPHARPLLEHGGPATEGGGPSQESSAPPQGSSGPVLAIATRTDRQAETRAHVMDLCKRLAKRADGAIKPVRALIAGVPNVGKSTLINTLVNRKVANVGDKPAVTKAQQQVVLQNGMVIHDTPGILWPKIEDESASLRLALAGSIPDTAIDYLTVALFGGRFFLERYPERLLRFFKLSRLPTDADELVEEIGRRRGCLRAGGAVDVHRAAEMLVHAFRSGGLGPISLESPDAATETFGVGK